MPSWAVQVLISLAIKALEYFSGSLNSGQHARLAMLPPATPLKSDPLPPPSDARNPNKAHHYE